MTQFIQSTPGTIAAAMGYSSQVPQSQYPTGQLGLAGGGIAQLPYGGGTIAGGNIQGTPMGDRTGFGFFSKAKKRLKKLIPKEAAPLMMAAAPFMGPIAGPITAGLGSYKTYGKINPMAMGMALAPHVRFGGPTGIGYGNWGQGGSSIRNLLTGKGVGTSRGILNKYGNFGNKIDAAIFGSPDQWVNQEGIHGQIRGQHKIPGKSGLFNTGGGKIGMEDVFKTLTTKDGKRDLEKITMIITASASYADALERAKDLGMGEGDLPFSNQDEYMAAKARLQGNIPTKPLIAHGGRVGHAFGSTPEEGDIGIEEEIVHSGDISGMDDPGIETFQETVPFEHEGAQPPAEDKGLMDSIASVLAAAGLIGANPYTIFTIMKMKGIGIMDAIEFVKNKMGGEEIIEEGEFPSGDFPHPDQWPDREFEPTPAVQFNAGGRAGYGLGSWLKRKIGMGQQEGTAVADPNVAPSGNLKDNLLNVFANKFSGKRRAIPLSGVEPPPGDLPTNLKNVFADKFAGNGDSFMGSVIPRAVEGGILSTPQGPENGLQEEYQIYIAGGGDLEFEDWVSIRQQAAHGGRAGYANGGINNTRTGLQWGSDKGEGLGGEEVEADMRYDGGFMPYGEEPKADDVPARLSKDEFVFTDQAVAGAGDGDIDLGAERLYNVMKSLEQGGRLSEETQGEMGQGIGELV